MKKNAFTPTHWTTNPLLAWQRFWFEPRDPMVLAVIRIGLGLYLFGNLLVYGKNLADWLGPDGWINIKFFKDTFPFLQYPTVFAIFSDMDSIYLIHRFAMALAIFFTVGAFTRVVTPLIFILVVSYVNRHPYATFGADAVAAFLVFYLSLGPCGARFSVDAWLAKRRGRSLGRPSSFTTMSTRLIQIHMCVVYLSAGICKYGVSWQDGSAIWTVLATVEGQRWSMDWMAQYPLAMRIASLLVRYTEIAFFVTIWVHYARFLTLLLVLGMHVGIGLFMSLESFSTVMLLGVFSFVRPSELRRVADVVQASLMTRIRRTTGTATQVSSVKANSETVVR